ncbi:MAG: hypothetical protein H0V53_09165 [Rubrobacter sp.]|nr:hypothetical protein [Rubrobacter sp.]
MRGPTLENGESKLAEYKKRLIKAARMYVMCEKTGVPEPLDVTALGISAFEELPITKATVFVQSNRQNIKDLAWALSESGSQEEFERKLKEIKDLPEQR